MDKKTKAVEALRWAIEVVKEEFCPFSIIVRGKEEIETIIHVNKETFDKIPGEVKLYDLNFSSTFCSKEARKEVCGITFYHFLEKGEEEQYELRQVS